MEIRRIMSALGKVVYQAITDKGTFVITVPRSTPMSEVEAIFQQKYDDAEVL